MKEQLRAFCQNHQLASGKIEIVDLASIADGWECEVYRFGLVSNGGARREELILRIYQGTDAALKAAAEFAILDEMHGAGYPVPRARALVTDSSPLGKPFVLMERIEGPVLGPLLRLPTGGLDVEGFRRFAGLLARLHALDWREVAARNRFFPIRGGLDRWLAWARALISSFGVTDYDEAFGWLERRASRVAPSDLAIVHQDFHPWNVLVRPSGYLVVIDWTQADVLDPRLDLAWTTLLLTSSFGSREPTSEETSARELVLAEYQAIAGPISDFEVFEVAAALKRLASITLALGGGAEKLGMRSGAEAKMRGDPRHLQTARNVLYDRSGLRIEAVEELLEREMAGGLTP